MQRATSAYLQTKVTTTSQGDILLMLYNGAVQFLHQAKERLQANDMAGKGNNISKALDVINELDSTLNMEKGGALADNLHNLYFFCSKRLVMANLKKSTEMIDEVIKILSGLRGAYAEIVSLPEAQAAAQEAAANQHATGGMPARPGTGHATSGADAPAPGAAARAKAMFAQHKMAQTLSGDAAPSAATAPVEDTGEKASVQAVPPAPEKIFTVLPNLGVTATYSQATGLVIMRPGIKPPAATPAEKPVWPAPQAQSHFQMPGVTAAHAFGAAPPVQAGPAGTESDMPQQQPLPVGTLARPRVNTPETEEGSAAAIPLPVSGFGRNNMAASALYRKFSG